MVNSHAHIVNGRVAQIRAPSQPRKYVAQDLLEILQTALRLRIRKSLDSPRLQTNAEAWGSRAQIAALVKRTKNPVVPWSRRSLYISPK